MSVLHRLLRLIGIRPSLDPARLQTYAEAVRPMAAQLEALYLRWRRQLESDLPENEMADAASIQRWQAAGLFDQLGRLEPPAAFVKAHTTLKSLTWDTARASQLLSNGYRFHSSRARCDGQSLMLSSEERFEALRRGLTARGLSVEPAAGDGAATSR